MEESIKQLELLLPNLAVDLLSYMILLRIMFSKIIRPSLATSCRKGIRSGSNRSLATVPIEDTSSRSSTEARVKAKPSQYIPRKEPTHTKGTIRFLGPTKDGKPAFLNFKKGEEHTTNFGPSLEKVVDITDLRYIEPQATLGVDGVEWIYAPTELSEDKLVQPEKEDVEAFVRGPYFDECAQLVKERTGALKVVAYNFRHRRIEIVRYNYPLPLARAYYDIGHQPL